MDSISPIVDCGVHYVDVMCQVTGAKPVRVHAIGVRLTDEVKPDMYNYGHLHVTFDDGSVGWYEAGWGPMMSETAFFVKDMIGPKGSVSIVAAEQGGGAGEGEAATASSDIDGHTKTGALRVHHAELKADGSFARADDILPHGGRARPPGAVRARAAPLPRRHPREPRHVRPCPRGHREPAHRAGGGQERADGQGGGVVGGGLSRRWPSIQRAPPLSRLGEGPR